MSTALRRHYTAADKAAAVALYEARAERRLSIPDIVRATGVPKATLLRWVAEAIGGRKSEVGGQKGKGRKPLHTFTDAEAKALRTLRLEKGSLGNAVIAFLVNEACRAESADFLGSILERSAATGKAPAWPPCVRSAAHLSEEEEAAFRGDRALGKYAPSISRGAYWIDARGNEVPLLPHDIWESDDMSANEPFRHVDPVTGETRIGRQILFTGDRFSAAMLGLSLIGRDRDAYRAEDILDHLLDLIDVFGMPRLWRIERGVWESKGIEGVALDDARARKLGYEGERWTGRRIGGLDHLFRIEHMFTSNGKGGIEGAFNHLQDLIAHESLHIGRERGEFEEAAKQLRRAQAGMPDAQAKFWEAGECAAAFLAAIGEANNRPKARTMFGGARHVPADLLRTHSVAKRTLPEGERWRFQPCKQLAVVQRGLISATVDGTKHTWEAMGEGIALDHGHRVVIAFHPHHPERGCTVVEAEFGPRNRERRPLGEPLFTVAPLELRPQWDERPADERDAIEHPGKRWKGQVRREFAAITGARKSHLADGRGRAATIEQGFGEERAAMAPASDPTAIPTRGRHTKATGPATRSTTPAVDADELRRLEEESLNYF